MVTVWKEKKASSSNFLCLLSSQPHVNYADLELRGSGICRPGRSFDVFLKIGICTKWRGAGNKSVCYVIVLNRTNS